MHFDKLEDGRPGERQAPRGDRLDDVLRPAPDLRTAADRAASALVAWSEGDSEDLELLEAGVTLGIAAQRAGVSLDAFALALAELWTEDHASCLTARRREGDKLLTRVAFKSFAVAQAGAARHEVRRLRHDLRNPLGTVRNSLALLEEELMGTAEVGHGIDRLRAMASRNITAAEELIRRHLTDGAAEQPWIGPRVDAAAHLELLSSRTPGGTPAFRLRNDTGERPGLSVDACALELALRVAIAVAELADRGVPEVTLGWRDEQARLTVSPIRDGARRDRAVALLQPLLACAGGHVVDRPASPAALVFELPASAGDQRNDLAGGRERHHGHAEAG